MYLCAQFTTFYDVVKLPTISPLRTICLSLGSSHRQSCPSRSVARLTRRRHGVHRVQSQLRLSWLSSDCTASLLCQSAIAQSGSTLSCDVTRCLDQLLRSLSLSTPITFRTKDGFCPLLPGVKAWPLGPQPDYGQSEVGVVGVVCHNDPHALLQVDPDIPSTNLLGPGPRPRKVRGRPCRCSPRDNNVIIYHAARFL